MVFGHVDRNIATNCGARQTSKAISGAHFGVLGGNQEGEIDPVEAPAPRQHDGGHETGERDGDAEERAAPRDGAPAETVLGDGGRARRGGGLVREGMKRGG